MQTLLNMSTMTIQEMTDRMEISRSNFYFWRDGKTIPKKSSFNKLADILKINLSWVDKNSVNIIEKDIQIVEENLNMNMDASYIIKLQKEKIKQLEKKVKSMKKKLKNIGKYIKCGEGGIRTPETSKRLHAFQAFNPPL